ncbi:MAG: toll/interleukin-1 receptor domain-containing protein [Paludibacter sp.]|nr:toll/interleukin-1 receptor domain-containing protein [Paludibacter sp.]
MGQSVLVFVSHSSEDKEALIEPIVEDLEKCYINVWLDKKKIVPGENLRKSILRDGLDKADIVLIFFTEKPLKSSWVDREIKHVLREDTKKDSDFDLNKIISIFDSKSTYDEIASRYPELTDDLLHLMPVDYSRTQLGQLVSAIWSKYFSFQGGSIETQKQLLTKDKELFRKDKEIQELQMLLKEASSKNSNSSLYNEFEKFIGSGRINDFIKEKNKYLGLDTIEFNETPNFSDAVAFGLIESSKKHTGYYSISEKGKEFFKWHILNEI